jgi:hypothetical protein
MLIPSRAGRNPLVLTAALTLLGILAAPGAQAQVLRITAANASNSAVYDVNFSGSGGSISVLNSDANRHVSLRSLVFIPNAQSGQIDLLIADSSRGEIVRYANATGAATVVWSTATGAGPTYPDGLSVDGAGNLFVASSASGNTKPAQLWVFPTDPLLPAGAGFLAPRLIDSAFGGLSVQTLEETVVARDHQQRCWRRRPAVARRQPRDRAGLCQRQCSERAERRRSHLTQPHPDQQRAVSCGPRARRHGLLARRQQPADHHGEWHGTALQLYRHQPGSRL